MCLRKERPFLRECGLPSVVVARARPEDVLEDSRLLIERFLDEKRVVENLERLCLGRRGGCQASTRSAAAATCTSTFEAARVPIVIRCSSLPLTRTLSDAASRSSTSIDSPGFR